MNIDLWGLQIPTAWVLAVVTALAYILGRCGRRVSSASEKQLAELERELRRAQAAATKLECIVSLTRVSLSKHQARLKRFKSRIVKFRGQPQDDICYKLCGEIEEILSPTVHLATQLASAHDVIRYESSLLTTFTDSRTDSLTGLCNRRGLDRTLAVQLAVTGRYGSPCSLVLLDVDHFKNVNDERGHLYGDQILSEVAGILEEEARETDVVARYGGDEFVIVMPQSGLDGAVAMAERLRLSVERRMSVTISGGVASAEKGDMPDAVFHRADVALYSAKVAGRNCVFYHHDGGAQPAPSQIAQVAAPADDQSPCLAAEHKV